MSDERYAPYQEFLGVPADLKPAREPRVAVLPVPYDLTTSYQPGARRGPLAILEASTHLETYDEELERETWEEVGIETLPAGGPRHLGPGGDDARASRAWRAGSWSPAGFWWRSAASTRSRRRWCAPCARGTPGSGCCSSTPTPTCATPSRARRTTTPA